MKYGTLINNIKSYLYHYFKDLITDRMFLLSELEHTALYSAIVVSCFVLPQHMYYVFELFDISFFFLFFIYIYFVLIVFIYIVSIKDLLIDYLKNYLPYFYVIYLFMIIYLLSIFFFI